MPDIQPVCLIVGQGPGYTNSVHLSQKPDSRFFEPEHLPVVRVQDKIHKVSP
jgi:hypothetical protein